MAKYTYNTQKNTEYNRTYRAKLKVKRLESDRLIALTKNGDVANIIKDVIRCK